MNKLTLIVSLFTLMMLQACSSELVYNTLRGYEQNQCETGPVSEHEACMKKSGAEYKTYEKNRKETS